MESTITIRLDKLIEAIRANMETHKETYDKAVIEFKRQQLVLLEEQVEAARTGRQFDRLALSRMPVPENHIDDYTRTLRMLEMHTEPELEIGQFDFNKYVLDEWEWRRAFTANTVAYASQA